MVADYVLEIGGWDGIVPARHLYGRVKGERPKSCHGAMHLGNWHRPHSDPLRGKDTCDEGHVIPPRAEWDVEDFWTEDQYKRLAAARFEGDGPAQFADQAKLIDVAVRRFQVKRERQWWEQDYPHPGPGDRLYLGYKPSQGAQPEPDGYGSLLCQLPDEAVPAGNAAENTGRPGPAEPADRSRGRARELEL